MDDKGIQFNIISKEEAVHFLKEHNYYVKLSSYRFNYAKYQGRYIGLDFFHLKELSTIDMHLKFLILKSCLNIEHSLKVNLLHDITSKSLDDFKLVREYNRAYPKCLNGIREHRNTSYTKHLLEKYAHPNYPIWVLLESISFGDLVNFYKFYSKHFRYSPIDYKILYNVRDIRNATAHSNCLLNNLGDKSNTPRTILRKELKAIGFGNTTIDNKLKNKSIHDFVAMLYALDKIPTSEEIKLFRFEDFQNFFNNRMVRSKEYFVSNNLLFSAYVFTKKIIDYYKEKV